MACNCEFCVKCDCGHSADSHIAGEGQCYVEGCKCSQFHAPVVDAWEKLPQPNFMTFQEFADKWLMENK